MNPEYFTVFGVFFSQAYCMIAHKNTDILPLTGLRFFAALFVCIAHINSHFIPPELSNTWFAIELTRLSAAGMSLFFVLSGFVIHYNYSKSIQAKTTSGLYDFFIARFARLFPLYFVFLCIDLLRHQYVHYESLPFYLTLTQSWFYKPIGEHSLIYQFGNVPSVAWSVSTEWFFYICYPIICLMLLKMAKISSKIIAMIIISVIAISFVAICTLNLTWMNEVAANLFGPLADFTTNNQDSFYRWIVYFSPYSRISEFMMGCLTAAIYMQISSQPSNNKNATLGLAVTILCLIGIPATQYFIFQPPNAGSLTSWISNLHRCFGFAPLFSVLIFCSAYYQNVVTRFLSFRFIQWGGEVSYSLYLIHSILIGAISRLLHKVTDNSFIMIVAALLLLISASSITFLTIESPARRFLRKALGRKKKLEAFVKAI